MADQPEPQLKPQFTARLVGWIVSSGATAAVAAVFLAAAAPPSPYSNLLGAVIVAAVVVGAVMFLTGVVLFVSRIFGKRYTETQQSIDKHQRDMTDRIDALIEQQQTVLKRQETILAKIGELDSRAQRICKEQQTLHNQVNRCMGEVSILAEGVSELREAFVEEGLPEHPEQLAAGSADPAPALLTATRPQPAPRCSHRCTAASRAAPAPDGRTC